TVAWQGNNRFKIDGSKYSTITVMIEQFRKGNEHSFNLLYKEFYRSLYYFALKIVQEEQEAEDIVTESMVKLWQQRIHFSQLAEVKSFLFITTQRAALNAIRNRQRHRQKELLIAKAVESENTDSLLLWSAERGRRQSLCSSNS